MGECLRRHHIGLLEENDRDDAKDVASHQEQRITANGFGLDCGPGLVELGQVLQ